MISHNETEEDESDSDALPDLLSKPRAAILPTPAVIEHTLQYDSSNSLGVRIPLLDSYEKISWLFRFLFGKLYKTFKKNK